MLKVSTARLKHAMAEMARRQPPYRLSLAEGQARLRQMTAMLAERTDNFCKKMDRWFAKIDEHFENIDQRFDRIEARLDSMLEQLLTELPERIYRYFIANSPGPYPWD